MLNWLRERISIVKPRSSPTLTLTTDGFRCGTTGRSHMIRWSAIVSIDAFKRDELTTDLICLEIATHENCLLVHEEMDGFNEFRDELERELGISADWFAEVMQPAFTPNLRRIFPSKAT